MALWDMVSSFMSIPDEATVDDDFEEWWGQLWQPVESACKNVARHSYVFKGALQEFREARVPCKTWTEAFDEAHEQKQLTSWCTLAGLDPTAFLEMGFEQYRQKCNMVYKTDRTCSLEC
jgi:hypothetical protein